MTPHVLEHLALTLVPAPALAAGWAVAVRVPAPVALLQFALVSGLVHVPAAWNATQREVALRVGVDLAVLYERKGGVAQGLRLFTSSCAGCHQIVGRGGVVTGGFSPSLQSATTRQIYEAVRVGPYFMPAFDRSQISDGELASIAKYVRLTRDPHDRGGWAIGNTGPVPEGMVTFLVGITALLGVTRLVGKRNR